jgi:hypothetical protein
MASIAANRQTATWMPKGGLSRGSRSIKVDITGLAELERVFGGTKPLYTNALKKVIKSATKVGRDRVARAVPQRTGALGGPLAQRYWDQSGPNRPQMGSVSAGSGVSATGFRYGWALNYGRQIIRTKPRVDGGPKPANTDRGYLYSARGTGVSSSRAGQPTYGWMSKAAKSMTTVISRDLKKAVRDIENEFGRRTAGARA